jgi:hypothetical protein
MKISGFSFVRNAEKLYYPLKASVESILPICDEFVIALGKGDDDDHTKEILESINSPKLKIIDTVWDTEKWKGGAIYATETDTALQHCKGDWCFYLQADEVIHEKYLDVIRNRCEQLLGDDRVEGLLFKYKHFWGDYDHYNQSHAWYPNEIRIIRNLPNIHSWIDAQSFRYYDEYKHPHQKEGTRKLNVASLDAEVYHYGWVRPPRLMQTKQKVMNTAYWGNKDTEKKFIERTVDFDYGPLNMSNLFRETHPKVMKEMIEKMSWKDELQYDGKPDPRRELHKHERFKYRFLSFLENNLMQGRSIGGFKNYNLLKNV